MFFVLAIIVFWLLFGSLAYMCKRFGWTDGYSLNVRKQKPNWYFTPAVALTGMLLLILCITTGVNWSSNVSDIATYRQIDNKIVQRDSVMTRNLPEIREILVDLYPQHEKDIFESISSRNAQWLWEKYPEMRAAETMQNYVGQLNTYTTWVQGMRENQLDLIASIETRKNSPWVINWFIPTINNRVFLEKD